MKKVLAIILALSLVLSMAVLFSACGNKKDTEDTTTEASVSEEVDTTAAEEEENLPGPGDTLAFGGVKVTIPEGWHVDTYREGDTVEIEPDNGEFLSNVGITFHNVYGDEHAKAWADNINGNYGGDKEIDRVTIAGKSFYRVKADPEQNVCFCDIDDSTFIEVSVMYMPWEDGQAVLDAISFS